MENENPKIEWLQRAKKDCLKFTFKETLTEQNAIIAIQKWEKAFASKPEEKIIIIWDCSKMSGYSTKSRILWQNALKEMKEQIDIIWLISQSSLIKMGASVMGLFTSLKIKTVSKESEIKFT